MEASAQLILFEAKFELLAVLKQVESNVTAKGLDSNSRYTKTIR